MKVYNLSKLNRDEFEEYITNTLKYRIINGEGPYNYKSDDDCYVYQLTDPTKFYSGESMNHFSIVKFKFSKDEINEILRLSDKGLCQCWVTSFAFIDGKQIPKLDISNIPHGSILSSDYFKLEREIVNVSSGN